LYEPGAGRDDGTIFLTVYGKQGLRELAEQNLAKADYLRRTLLDVGASTKFDGTPRFHEFVLTSKDSAGVLNSRLLEKQIIGGLALGQWYPELGENATLWCATELTTKAQMDAAAKVLAGAREQELVGVK
jgi:glycine dehydrogenase subunit 1